ncbi:hypothetical protein GCM10029976_083720 [Kribbella albertanoniae]
MAFMDERVEGNLAGWDLRAEAHTSGTSLYDVDGFRAGGVRSGRSRWRRLVMCEVGGSCT